MTYRGINTSVVDYSLSSNCIDTSKIISNEMHVGHNHMVPEDYLLDTREVGLWEVNSMSHTVLSVWDLDEDKAGREGLVSQILGTKTSHKNKEFCCLSIANLRMSRIFLPYERTNPVYRGHPPPPN